MLCPIYMSCPLCSNSHPHPSSKCPVCPQNWPAATTCINRHYQKAVQVHVIQNRVMLVSFLYFDIDKNQRRGTCLLVLSVVIGIALWLYNVHICHCDILTKPQKLYNCFCNIVGFCQTSSFFWLRLWAVQHLHQILKSHAKAKLKVYYLNFPCTAGMKVNSIWSIDLLVPLGAGEVEEDSAHTIEPNLQNDMTLICGRQRFTNQCRDFVGSAINHKKRNRLGRFGLSWINRLG